MRALPTTHSGSLSLAEVAGMFDTTTEPSMGGEQACLRVVASPVGRDTYIMYSGSLTIEPGLTQPGTSVRSAGGLRLIEVAVPVARAASAAGLRELLTAWMKPLGLNPELIHLQDVMNFSRTNSGGTFGAIPHWVIQAYQTVKDVSSTSIAQGPFFDRRNDFFAASEAEAVEQWLLPRRSRSAGLSQSHVGIILPDDRAYFGELSLEADSVVVEILGSCTGNVSCACLVRTVSGAQPRIVRHELEEYLRLPREGGDVACIQLHLLGAEGFVFDELYEDEHRCTRVGSVLQPARTIGPAEEELKAALESGECDTVEFKEWLPLQRTKPKSYELLKTVCAFANAQGGSLFVGVTDELEIRGVEAHLHRDFGEQGGDIEGAQTRYVAEMTRMINQGIGPRPTVSTEWIRFAGMLLLVLTVHAVDGRMYSVVETRQSFVRRGANCVQITAMDLDGLRRSSHPSTLGVLSSIGPRRRR